MDVTVAPEPVRGRAERSTFGLRSINQPVAETLAVASPQNLAFAMGKYPRYGGRDGRLTRRGRDVAIAALRGTSTSVRYAYE